MHKKLREIFNWFQQKAIRRMSLKNVLNEYYFRMDGSGTQSVSGASYKRQAVVYREKTIDDWIMSVTSATDPDDPRRGLLYRFYQSLYNDEHLQTTIDNRVLPVQQAEFNLVDDNDNEDKEAKKLLDRPWYHQLIRICFLHQLQGVSLADISHLDDNLEISHVEEVPMSNYIPQQMIIVKEESDKTGWSYKDGALEPYYVQFGNAWALGMLNELAVIILAKKLGLGSWMNYIEKYGIPPVFVTSDRQDKKRLDELFEMMQDFRNNFFAVLSGNEKVEYGKEAGGNTTNAFLPLEERCDNQISKRLLGQTGTTENGAWEGTAEIHERVEKSRHEYDKMVFQFYFNYIIIPKLVKISPVYKPLERLKLKWDDTESLSITEYIEAINKLAYTFEFDHEEVAKKTGLPIIGQKANPGSEQQGGNQPNSKNHPNDESKQDNTQKKKSNPNKAMTSSGIADMINSLYCQDGETPTDDAGFSLSDKIRDRILERLHSKGFDVEKDIDPDLFAHTFDSISKGVDKGFGKVEYNTPDAAFLNELRHNCMVFAAFKTHRQQNELHALLMDEDGKRKGFDQFRKDTEKILQDYNVNWLRTEYDTAVRRARFAADFRGYVANKDLYPNLEWLPSVSVNPREAHKIFYGTIRPVDDPFWNTNFPGNLWNCKCRVKSTDAPVNVKGKEEPVPPAPGLDKNPGITEEVFTGSHPYIKDADKKAQEAVENFLNKNILNTVGNEKTTRKVTAIENEIRMNKSHETGMVIDKNGKVIIDKRGEAFQVQFTDSECLLMKDNIMTHNHPRGWGQPEKSLGRIGSSFSIEDLTLAVGNDVAEIRAVTPHYTFSMKRPKSGWGVTVKELKMVYMANELKLRDQFMKRIKKNTLTPSQANATHFHLLARQIAKQYNWTYEKKKTR
ncbi:phage portal protein family protein [Bacteroides acidifaciens]|uniref:phage portal protein family protein n=4 Tax=Bacteroides acidifaciens TaxID=85831 RepID=UPI0025582911|nr:DUF935 family protein [Bacteroides acidifaciens]